MEFIQKISIEISDEDQQALRVFGINLPEFATWVHELYSLGSSDPLYIYGKPEGIGYELGTEGDRPEEAEIYYYVHGPIDWKISVSTKLVQA